MTRIRGTLHENTCTFLIISPRILLRMRKFSGISCREYQNTHFMFHIIPPRQKIVPSIKQRRRNGSSRQTDRSQLTKIIGSRNDALGMPDD
jgi:hypothetical protein